MKACTAIRKTVKWGGAVAVVLLVAVWAASGWWYFGWQVSTNRTVSCSSGLFSVEKSKLNMFVDWGARWLEVRHPQQPVYCWWEFGSDSVWGSCRSVPIWIPTLVVLLPTVLAWRSDRRALRLARIGLCPACGYDRTGLAAAQRCPECNAENPPASPPR